MTVLEQLTETQRVWLLNAVLFGVMAIIVLVFVDPDPPEE